MSYVFAALPTLLGRGNERTQKAQKAMIYSGITAPSNFIHIEHAHVPKTSGRVTVRHSGFGVLIVISSR